MKRLVKRILPSHLLPFARKFYAKMVHRGKPRFTTMPCQALSVLQCCIAYNKYGGYCVPLSSQHRPAAQKILTGDIYEPKTIEFMISHCKEGDLVHAGTYFGDFLPALSRSCAPEAKIWAFEPNPENYRCALITSYINGLKNVELTNAGLGERQDSLVMMVIDASGRALGGASRILAQGTKNISGSTETVQIVAVDEIIPLDRKVSIIQLDVEGYEKQALYGALKTIRRCLPVLILESLPEDTWLSENILQLGYRVGQTIDGNTVLMCD